MSQDHLHQADRDYSAANEPNEEKLLEQLESAMMLADMFQGRRRVGPDGRGFRVAVDPGYDPEVFVIQPIPVTSPPTPEQLRPGKDNILKPGKSTYELADEYDKRLEQTMRAFRNEPSDLGTTDIALLNDCIAVIRDRVRRLRESGVGDGEVGKHACATLDLGMVGLAKLAGKE